MCLHHLDHHTTRTDLCQLVVAEVQVDQRVELGEARQLD